MAEALGATIGPDAAGMPEVLPDARAQDEAYQELVRARSEQDRLEARLEQQAGLAPGSAEGLEDALAEPDVAEPGAAQGQLAARRQSAAQAMQRVQQARQIAQTAQSVAATARKVRWLVMLGQATIAVLANPYTWLILLLTPVLFTIGYCAVNAADCSALLGAVVWDNVKAVFGVTDSDTKVPSTDIPSSAGTAPAGSQDASDTGSAASPAVESTATP